MTPETWLRGEVAVIGLARSGDAATRLLRAHHASVYASDAAATPAVEGVAGALRAIGAQVQVGGHDIARIAKAALVVVSPGVPAESAPLAAARAAGVPIVGELELAVEAMPKARYIAVTGTNGKTTVTSIVGHLLTSMGLDVEIAGNIGRPLSNVAMRVTLPDWIALEVSSYQLHDAPGLRPAVGVLTNLSPDHLDRYTSVEDYYADKKQLFRNATSESRWVVNYDDQQAMALVRGVAGYALRFSAEGRLADAFWDRQHDALIVLDEPLIRRSELPLLGDHNVGNALAAAVAVMSADAAFNSLSARVRIAAGLRTMRPLPHRLETVGEIDGVLWVNDSKATNVASARVGIRSMTRPTILLLGGKHKGEPYGALAEPISQKCKAVIAYGEAAEQIQRDLSASVPLQRVAGDFHEVVQRARSLAARGDCVLLSPACSSFDMFANYEERGMTFARLARREESLE